MIASTDNDRLLLDELLRVAGRVAQEHCGRNTPSIRLRCMPGLNIARDLTMRPPPCVHRIVSRPLSDVTLERTDLAPRTTQLERIHATTVRVQPLAISPHRRIVRLEESTARVGCWGRRADTVSEASANPVILDSGCVA